MPSLINGQWPDPFAAPEPPPAQQSSPSAPADLSAPTRPAVPPATVAGLPGAWAGSATHGRFPQVEDLPQTALLRQYRQPSIAGGGSGATLASIDGPRLSAGQLAAAEGRLARALGDPEAVITSVMSELGCHGVADFFHLRECAKRLTPDRLKREVAIQQALDAAPDVPARDIAARLNYTHSADVAFIERMRNPDAAG